MNRVPTTHLPHLALGVAFSLLAGCQIGPRLLPMTTATYAEAVRVSQSEQLLANLVRLHYSELPVFLAVTDISAQFSVTGSAALGGSAGGDSDFTAGGGFAYSERPTLSLSILAGEDFQRRMLSPLDVGSISLLVSTGWRIDRVLMLAVERLNGVHNAITASGPTPALAPEYAEFREVASLLEELRGTPSVRTEYRSTRRQVSGSLPASQMNGSALVDASQAGLTFEKTLAAKDSFHLTLGQQVTLLRFAPTANEDPRIRRLRSILRLDPSVNTFDIVALAGSSFDSLNPDATISQLAIDTRSLMGVLFYLSNGVDTPQEHRSSGLIRTTKTSAGEDFDWHDLLGDLITVHSSSKRPKNAAIAVQHRGYWFYVADDDASTKSTFLLLSQLFALQSGEPSRQKPVLTLPVGG